MLNQLTIQNEFNYKKMAGKWKKMSNLLIDNGKKIGDAAKHTQYTTNGLRIALERSKYPSMG